MTKVQGATWIECDRCGFKGWVEDPLWCNFYVGGGEHESVCAVCMDKSYRLEKIELADDYWFRPQAGYTPSLPLCLHLPTYDIRWSVRQVAEDGLTAWGVRDPVMPLRTVCEVHHGERA